MNDFVFVYLKYYYILRKVSMSAYIVNGDKKIYSPDDIIYIDYPMRGDNIKEYSSFSLGIDKLEDSIISEINDPKSKFITKSYPILPKLKQIEVERRRLFKKESAILIDSSQIVSDEVEINSELYDGGWKSNKRKIKENYDYRIVYSNEFDLTPKNIPGKTIFCNSSNTRYILLPYNTDNIDILEITNEDELVGLNYKDYAYISDPDSIKKIIKNI